MIDTAPHSTEIEIGIVVPAVIYAPVWLAEQRGFLRDEGLTVRLRSFGSTESYCPKRLGLLNMARGRLPNSAEVTSALAEVFICNGPHTGALRR
jgi:hypothetical protein